MNDPSKPSPSPLKTPPEGGKPRSKTRKKIAKPEPPKSRPTGQTLKKKRKSRFPKKNAELPVDADENLSRRRAVSRWSWSQVSATLLATGSVPAAAGVLSATPSSLYSWLSKGKNKKEWNKIKLLWRRERLYERAKQRERNREQENASWFEPLVSAEHREAIRLLAEGDPDAALALLADVGDVDDVD